ncbi:MAG TPA: carbamoyltransferase HypF, partial [Acidobacteriota bacterium]|nr:carbamoyltransferase HypF [Acidobacteriota bacterium]
MTESSVLNQSLERLEVRILGIVQGVGFRPFIYRLAKELKLSGWVKNDGNGITSEVEGDHNSLLSFLQKVQQENPPASFIYALDHRFLQPNGYKEFSIHSSEVTDSHSVWVLPDLATCNECRSELTDKINRRYQYPFTNCTNCGPRFTIIENLPYDRPFTSMKHFQMCNDCLNEYEAPLNRRFHAQPNACKRCGPVLSLISNKGDQIANEENALHVAAEWIREGKILAVKGIGGYHLIVDARNQTAVMELRRRKERRNKPFAVMYPDLQKLRKHVEVPSFAEPFLTSAQAPILLLRRTSQADEICDAVAPLSPYLGVFLPYTPLHILLLKELNFPVVATSGNLSEDPIQYDDYEAIEHLRCLCDAFLIHNRPIVHQADDSVIHIVEKPETRMQILRRARGYTPFPILAKNSLPPLLAVGGHMNVTFAISRNHEIIPSPHLGDMENYESRITYTNTVEDFLRLYKVHPEAVVHDLHPGYYTTQFAENYELPKIGVQHHHAHLAACMLENQIEEPVIGFTWDGTGYGTDETIWGGEFLLGTPLKVERVGSLFPFTLPGGEKAIKQPWRTCLSLLHECYGKNVDIHHLNFFNAIPAKSIETTLQIMNKPKFSPVTSSMGRLFDGISVILGLSYYNTYQAESAQLLEYAAWRGGDDAPLLPFEILETD